MSFSCSLILDGPAVEEDVPERNPDVANDDPAALSDFSRSLIGEAGLVISRLGWATTSQVHGWPVVRETGVAVKGASAVASAKAKAALALSSQSPHST